MKRLACLPILFTLWLMGSAQLQLPIRNIGGTDYYYRLVNKGETIYSIAKELGISEVDIMTYNPSVADGLKRDQWLFFPVEKFQKGQPKQSSAAKHIHNVKPGETVYGISKTYNITIDELIAANPALEHGLKSGTDIVIPTKPNQKLHTIQKGETLYRIALNNSVTIEDLMNANPGISPSNFKAGETIIIPEQDENLVKEKNKPTTIFIAEKVEKGDTYESIAKQHNASASQIRETNPDNSSPKKGSYVYVPISVKRDNTEQKSVEDIYNQIHEVDKSKPLKIALILPLGLNDSTYTNKEHKLYGDFYGGFLLGLKKHACEQLNIDVTVIDSSVESIYTVCGKSTVKDADIIISAYEDDSLVKINRFGEENKIYVVNPFTIKDVSFYENDRCIQLNTPSSYMYDAVRNYVNDQFSEYRIVYIGDDDTEEKPLISKLKETDNIWQTISPDELSVETFRNLVPADKKILFVPVQSSQSYLARIAPSLNILRKELSEYYFELLGYPEWITYKKYHKFFRAMGTYVYSRYCPVNLSKEAGRSLDEFENWYNRQSTDAIPQMTAYGYDIADYFYTLASKFGNDINAYTQRFEGTHGCFELKRASNWSGFVNSAIYIINYNTTSTEKIIIK